jgi:hypothetical protein
MNEKRKLAEEKQEQMAAKLIQDEIVQMNLNSPSFDPKAKIIYFTRAQTLPQLDNDSDNDDFTDELSDLEETEYANLTANDAEELDSDSESEVNEEVPNEPEDTDMFEERLADPESSLVHCACHNFQLVIKDGLKLCEDQDKLIKRVSKDIVSKSKMCSALSEQLREFDMQMAKKNVTRWNSILFMIRSVLKFSSAEFLKLKESLPRSTKKQRQVYNKFDLKTADRASLKELKEVLEPFEYVTDQLQSNRVTSSRVLPCIKYLRVHLEKPFSQFKYTASLRITLLDSFNRRVLPMEKKLCFTYSSFLDPLMGLETFTPVEQLNVKQLIKRLLVSNKLTENNSTEDTPSVVHKQISKFIYHSTLVEIEPSDTVDTMISQFTKVSKAFRIEQESKEKVKDMLDALDFWKIYEHMFPELSKLAKRYLGIPASSAQVERMFSIAGHIFNPKRRRLGDIFFCNLVFLKLNEDLI